MSRFQQLLKIVDKQKPKTIVEVGTWNGVNALRMATVALQHNKEVHYYGFDLFEDATPENDESELNVKQHASIDDVCTLFNSFAEQHKGFTYTLSKGNTKETLSADGPWKNADLAFIDGGHSVETIASDFENLRGCKVIVLDDAYFPDEAGNCVDTKKFGCNFIAEKENVIILPLRDVCNLGGQIGMLVMPPQACPYPVNLQVKTRNCVPDEQLLANFKYATTVHKRWAPCCSLHQNVAVMISAGPSYLDHLDEIRELAAKPGHYLFCVKTNHAPLINLGIIPFGCILLDPRPKVRRFVTPHPAVKYFISSVSHPSVVDMLHEFDTYLYNAVVGAGEVELIKTCSPDPRSKRMIANGSTAAGRAIALLRVLGFYKMKLYGYDSCYREPQDQDATTKDGTKKFWEISRFGKKFWSSLEMVAQVQDFEQMFQHTCGDPSFEMEFIGDGIIPHVYKNYCVDKDDFDKEFPNG